MIAVLLTETAGERRNRNEIRTTNRRRKWESSKWLECWRCGRRGGPPMYKVTLQSNTLLSFHYKTDCWRRLILQRDGVYTHTHTHMSSIWKKTQNTLWNLLLVQNSNGGSPKWIFTQIHIHYLRIENAEGYVLIAVYLFIYLHACYSHK